MKKIFILFMITGALAACSSSNRSISIAIKDTDELFSVKADYPEDQTEIVHDYISDKLGSDHLFESYASANDREMSLSDGTKVNVKSSKGSVTLSLDKKKSSHEGYERLKKIAEGLGRKIE